MSETLTMTRPKRLQVDIADLEAEIIAAKPNDLAYQTLPTSGKVRVLLLERLAQLKKEEEK